LAENLDGFLTKEIIEKHIERIRQMRAPSRTKHSKKITLLVDLRILIKLHNPSKWSEGEGQAEFGLGPLS
jgi:hypothetical protein